MYYMKIAVRSILLFCVIGISGLNAQQTIPLWRQALGGAVIGVPAAQTESVVAVCDGGTVQTYSRHGTFLWSFNAQGRLSPFITRSGEGTSYICRTNGLFIAINRTGRELWRINLGQPITSPVLVGWDGRIFIPCANRITCYTASGYLLWSKPLSQAPFLPLRPDTRGGLITVLGSGEILAMNPYGKAMTRKLREIPAVILPLDRAAACLLAPNASKAAEDIVKAAAEEAARAADEAAKTYAQAEEAAVNAEGKASAMAATAQAAGPAQAAGVAAQKAREAALAAALTAEAAREAAAIAAAKIPPVFTGDELTVLAIYRDGQAESIRWYNLGDSHFAATFPSLGTAPVAAVNRGDKIGAFMANGRVLLFSITENRTLWSQESHIGAGDTGPTVTPEALPRAFMIYDERGLYVLTGSGAAGYAEDGKPLWAIPIRNAASPPAFGDEGILYSGGNDWVLYAYHPEDTIKTQKQSLYGPAPEGSYGMGNPRPSPWAEDQNRFDGGEISVRLRRIAAAIGEGRVGENERNYTAYLMEIAGSVAESPVRVSPLHPPVQVNHRAEATRLLAGMGSRETIPFLAALLRADPDPAVKTAAAEAIGYIGVDPDGIALAAFTAQVLPQGAARDERLLAAVAAATGSLCRFSGPPLNNAGIRILSVLSDSGPALAQAVARRELQSLW
jgi:outer membrane protein assembly factor BamB